MKDDFRRVRTKAFGLSPKDDPTIYPGKKPNYSYLYDGDYIKPLDLYNQSVSSALKSNNITDAIYAIIGYGSNACPSQMAQKFTDKNEKIPVVRGRLKNYDIVYGAKSTQYGSIPATIIESPGTVVEAWIQLLTKKQLEHMTKTESNYYMMKINTKFEIENGENITPAYAYIHKSGALTIDKQPIALSDIPAFKRTFLSLNQMQVLKYIADNFASGNVQEVIEFAINNNTQYHEYLENLSFDKTIKNSIAPDDRNAMICSLEMTPRQASILERATNAPIRTPMIIPRYRSVLSG